MTELDETTMERLRTDGDQPAPLFDEPRRCAYQPCSKPLVRQVGEQPWHFTRRACCNASCANRKAQGSTAPLELPAEKTCEECGTTTTRREGESPGRWAERRFCSKPCAARNTVRRVTPTPAITGLPVSKVCVECGAVMRRREGERTNRWRLRECCSRSCASKQKARAAGKTVGGKPRPKPAPKRKPTPPPAPVPVPEPVRAPVEVWRPASWSKTATS